MAEGNVKVCEVARLALPLQEPMPKGQTILLDLPQLKPLFAMILEVKRTGNSTDLERFAVALGYYIRESKRQHPRVRTELFVRWIPVTDAQKGPPFKLPLTLAQLYKELAVNSAIFNGSKTELRRKLLEWGFEYRGQKLPKH